MYRRIQKVMAILDIILTVLIIAVFLGLENLSDAKPLATFIIFFSVLINIIVFWRHRISIVLIALGVLLAIDAITVSAFVEYAHIDVIAFLLGMMIIVAFLEDRGFFDALLGILMSRFGGSARRFFLALMLMAALFAALVDEVSSILFMCAIVLKTSKKYNVSPVPFIISVVFATNVGSSFTLLGNPVGVLIAFEGNFTFFDFIVWALPVGLIVLGVTMALTLWLFRKDLRMMDQKMRAEIPHKTNIHEELLAHPEMRVPMAIFFGTIAGLIVHHPLELLFGLDQNTLLLGIPLIAAAISLVYERDAGIRIIEKRIQWSTLIFFIFFFGVAGALEYTGVTQIVAAKITSITSNDLTLQITTFTWLVGITSAFMDNVLAVSTIAPIVSSMGVTALWWAVLFGACYMGNMTIIGSSANIVAHNYYEKNTGKEISFFEWLKPGIVVALVQTFLAMFFTILLHVYLFPA